MTSREYIKAKLFEVAYEESNGKAGNFGLIIAHCLGNRVRRNMGTWLEVLDNVPKYRANEPEPKVTLNLFEPQTQMLLQGIDNVYENAGNDLSNGGIYYCFTARGVNEWFKTNVIEGDYSVTSTMIDLKIWGEKTIIGLPPYLGW